MPEPDLTALFLRPLEAAGLDRYMVSGSIASIEYGEPRAILIPNGPPAMPNPTPVREPPKTLLE